MAKKEYIARTQPSGAQLETVEDAINFWLMDMAIKHRSTTHNLYKTIMANHIIPEFGGTKIADLDVNSIRALIHKKLGMAEDSCVSLSKKTVSDIFSAFKYALRYSAEETKIDKNCLEFALPSAGKPIVDIFSIPDQVKLESFLKTDVTLPKMGVYLCLYTGIRLGELCALKWSDIDFSTNLISINKSIKVEARPDNKGNKTSTVVGETKTKASVRKIPMTSFLQTYLKLHRQSAPESAYILTGTGEKFMIPRTMQNKFKEIITKLEIDKKNFHSLRHPYVKLTTKKYWGFTEK